MPRHKANTQVPRNTLEKKLAEVRKDRAAATKLGSFGATSAMHRLEFDIVRAIWEREAAEAAEARRKKEEADAAADPLALMTSLISVVREWPLPLRERLVAELTSSAGR